MKKTLFYCVTCQGGFCGTRHKSLQAAQDHKIKKTEIKQLREGEFTTVKNNEN